MTVKSKSTTKQSTEVKDEKMKTIEDIRKHLDKYENIKNSKKFTYRQKDILSLMLFRGNGQYEGFTMGYKHITDTFGYSSTAISAAISLFKDYNFISVEKGHTGTNSKYTLNYEAMKNFKSSSTVSVSDSEIREAKSEKRSKIREEKTYDTVIQLLTRLLSDLQIREEKRRESEKRYNAENQALIRLLSDKFDTVIDLMNQRLNININNNINKNLKDIISSNNNTEGNITRNQEKKKNISTGNLEKLKENSKDENSNDEIIPSGMKDSSEDKDNVSKAKSSKDEISNESRIPSEDNISRDNISTDENPNDMPPLDVDCFFEDSNSTEYRTNENLNEENETSMDENSKANENPEDNEISVFGDSNSTDEDKDKDNDKWYESSRSSKSDNHANGMFTNLISELTSNENPKANEISNDNNSKTSENMKKTSNKTNTIPSEGKNPSDEKTLKNINAFGKLQSFRDLNTGRIDGYQFNSYDNLNDSRDYSKSFHASVLCLNLEPSDLKKVSVSDTGVWGILNRTNGVYSFIPSNVGPSYAPNNALQGDETSKVDNHTAEDEKATETVYADEKITEVDNHTTYTEITAGNSVKMRPEPSDSNTNTTDTPNNALQAPKTSEVDSNTTDTNKTDSTQSQIANKASNAYTGVLEDDAETIAIRERVMRQNAARAQQTEKKSDDKIPKDFDYYKRTPDGWKEIPIHITMENKKMTMGEALELYKNFDNPLLYIYSIMRYVQDFCEKMKTALRLKAITDEQFNAFKNELDYISERYKAYWRKRFSYQEPDPNSSAEKDMHRWLGSPKVTQGKN